MESTRTWVSSLGAALVLLLSLPTASATPIISVDTDPGTPGIQSTLTVGLGTTFTVRVVIRDDGTPTTPTVFDNVILHDTGVLPAFPAPPKEA